MDNRPIGVFDSGLGGLTAVRELRELLPHEDIIYFGDTGRVPYGGRGNATITRYALQDAALLLSRNVKAVVSACGTVSSVAGELLAEHCPCPYIEVVTPAARRAAELSVSGKIGVIATRATIASGKYQQAIASMLPTATVTAIACPIFVPLVEEGHYSHNDELVRAAVQLYLGAMRRAGVDTLILGCTHYPLLAEAIAIYMGNEVVLVDSGKEAAKATAELLTKVELLAETGEGSCSYMVTDAPQNFESIMERFMGGKATGTVERVTLETLERMGVRE